MLLRDRYLRPLLCFMGAGLVIGGLGVYLIQPETSPMAVLLSGAVGSLLAGLPLSGLWVVFHRNSVGRSLPRVLRPLCLAGLLALMAAFLAFVLPFPQVRVVLLLLTPYLALVTLAGGYLTLAWESRTRKSAVPTQLS